MKKFRKSFLFFCFIFISIYIFSQKNIDSLKYHVALKNSNQIIDSAKKYKIEALLLKGYNKKSSNYYVLKQYNNAINTAKLLLKLSLQLKNDSMVGLSYKKLATYYRLADSSLLSYKYYKKYYEISRVNKDTLAQVKALRHIAIFEKDFGSSQESENNATNALILVNKLKSNKKISEARLALYNHIGILYKERGDYDKAIELYNKALAKVINQDDRNTILNNIANVYLEQKKYDAAIGIYTKIYNKVRNSKDTTAIARVLSNLGLTQSYNNNPNGFRNMKKALKIRTEKNNIDGIYHSYIHLAEYYMDKNDTVNVKRYADSAYLLAQKMKNAEFKKEALSFLIQINKNKKVVEYKKINYSLAAVERTNTNKFANQKYDLKIANQKETRERFYKLLYLAIGTFLLILLLFTVITLKRKNKKDKQQQAYETETRISQKVHDEVANDVFGIMTKLQVKESENMEILDDLERVYFKTRDISKENSIINFKEDFGTILQDLLVSYGDNQVNVITRNLNKIDWQTLSKPKKTVIYRVLQELMTNMKKHSKASITIVSFSKKNKKITINYKDNGIGSTLKKNVGLQIAETRIKSINGNITFESQTNKGFEVKIIV